MIQLAGMEVMGCLNIVISFVLGSRMIASGDLTVGKLIGFYTLCGLAVTRLATLCTSVGTFSQNAGIMKKIGQVLDVPDEKEEGCEMDVADEDIVLDHVDFSYQSAKCCGI